MTIRYDGCRKTMTKSRMAMITYNELTEETKIIKIVDFLRNTKGWHSFDFFDSCVVFGVNDREEYNLLLADYKEAKKMLSNI